MQVVERPFSYKMRYWDIWLGDEHIGIVGFNKESENIHYKIAREFVGEDINYIVLALDAVKSQLIEEILLDRNDNIT